MPSIFKRKKKPSGPVISKNEFLMLKPIRNPSLKWEKNEKGEVELTIPVEQSSARKGIPGKVMTKFMPPLPKKRKIRLDKVGSMVWELCDGDTTVREVTEALHNKYKMMTVEAELSLDVYFKQLSKRGLLAFNVPEELHEKLKDKDVTK